MILGILMLVGCDGKIGENEMTDTKPVSEHASLKEVMRETTTKEITTGEIVTEEQIKKKTDDMSYQANGKTPQLMIDVILNDEEFIFVELDYSTKEKIATWSKSLAEFNYEMYEFQNEPVEFGGYRVKDLDGDGYNEVILDIPTTETLILHYEDNEVYGFSYPWLGIKKIYLSGIIEGATGGSRTSYSIMKFDKDSYTEINVAECNDGICYIESKEVTSDEYMKYISSDKFTGEVPYWYDYKSILTTK